MALQGVGALYCQTRLVCTNIMAWITAAVQCNTPAVVLFHNNTVNHVRSVVKVISIV